MAKGLGVMGRLEKRRKKIYETRKLRFRALLGLLLCVALFYFGLTTADKGFKDMLDRGDDRPIFGVYGLKEAIIKLEFAGNEISIDKAEWKKACSLVGQRVKQMLGLR